MTKKDVFDHYVLPAIVLVAGLMVLWAVSAALKNAPCCEHCVNRLFDEPAQER